MAQSNKELSIVVLSESELVSLSDRSLSDIEILYKDIPVDNLSVITLKLRNSGNEAIRVNDYSKSIDVILGENVRVIDVDVYGESPFNLRPDILYDSISVSIGPLLLNKGDEFLMSIHFISNDVYEPVIDSRIVGIKEPLLRYEMEDENKSIENPFFFIIPGIITLWLYFYNAGMSTPSGYRKLFSRPSELKNISVKIPAVHSFIITAIIAFPAAFLLVNGFRLTNASGFLVILSFLFLILLGVPFFSWGRSVYREMQARDDSA